MSSSPIRIICFDLGGVVVRICRTWEEACDRAGIAVRDMASFRAPLLAQRRHELVHHHQTGAMDDAEFFHAVAGATGGLYSPGEVERVHHAWLIDDYPGMRSLIERLNAIPGITTACLSNTNGPHWDVLTARVTPAHPLQASRVIPLLRRQMVSHEMRAAKPHEAIYRLAESVCAARPDEILFFDDLEENVNAARTLGWNAERIDHTGDPAAQAAAHLLHHGVRTPNDG